MRKLILTSFFSLVLAFQVIGQFNQRVSQQIDSLGAEDQKWRVLLRQVRNNEVDSIEEDLVLEMLKRIDSLNYIEVKKIFDKHGYPGYDMVGESSSHKFWLLIQHADRYPDFQRRVLGFMKHEADRGNSSLSDWAYLVDRVKVNTNQLQIYGTQMKLNSNLTSYEPKPVIEPEKLNERRKSVGLGSIEDYIGTMNEHYRGSLK